MKKNIHAIMLLLRKEIGVTTPAVLHATPFKTLIATILSARTKDTTTFPASLRLFKKFPTPEKLSRASPREIEKLIFPVGFYKTKAKHIIQASKLLLSKFNGKVPKTLEELTSLPGVGKKTAGCVLVYAFRIPDIPVDVHVAVISQRLGLTKEKEADKIRLDLMKKVPKPYWLELNELMVKHGQRVCITRKPKCEICHLQKICDYYIRKTSKT
ncbi:MAG: endonuclease III [Candidatus Diapherotrites archaeon]|nr:endonuclease III [Candidatus Diapherotrites archaeon]